MHFPGARPPVNRAKGLVACLFLAGTVLLPMISCRPKPASVNTTIALSVRWSPSPPVVGATTVTIAIADANVSPRHLESLDVEANMNHAGMRPVFAHLKETEPGRYSGTIEFTMGGDWFMLLSGKFSDGSRLDQKVDVPGVRNS